MKSMFADFEFSSSPKNTGSTSKKPIGAIVGGSIGGAVGLLAILGLAIFLVRRRKKKASGPEVGSDKNEKGIPPPHELDGSTRREKVVSYELSSSGHRDTLASQELDASASGYRDTLNSQELDASASVAGNRDTMVSPELEGSEVEAAAAAYSAKEQRGGANRVSGLQGEVTGVNSTRG